MGSYNEGIVHFISGLTGGGTAVVQTAGLFEVAVQVLVHGAVHVGMCNSSCFFCEYDIILLLFML